MGKMYEVISKAQEENNKNYLEPVRKHSTEILPVLFKRKEVEHAPAWFKELKAKIQIHYNEIKVIMFTGTSNGYGVTTISAGFASSLAKNFELKVLLIDFNFKAPGVHKYFDDNSTNIFQDLFSDGKLLGLDVKSRNRGHLYVITCNGFKLDEVSFLGSENFDNFLGKIRDKFDYVILDTPPVAISSDSQIFSQKADGVVLVVESSKTRKQVAVKARKEIQAAGAKLLGVVINRRKHYIPKWLYKWL